MQEKNITSNSTLRPFWIVLCGIVRDFDEFSSVLQYCIELKRNGKVDGIVFSTWLGHLDKIVNLRALLEILGIVIVESSEPIKNERFNPNYKGNVFLQHKAFLYGLRALPDDAYVLKLRTDKVMKFVNKLDRFIFEKEIDIILGRYRAFPVVFKEKIFIDIACLNYFFFIIDIMFIGRKSDLLKLINFDGIYDVIYYGSKIPAEMRWFSMPFIRSFCIFDEYFRRCIPDRFVGATKFWARSNGEVELPRFIFDLFATYLLVLQTHFALPRRDGTESVANLTFKDVLLGAQAYGGDVGPFGAVGLYDQKLVEDIVVGRKLAGACGKRLYESMERVSDNSCAGHQWCITERDILELRTFNEVCPDAYKFLYEDSITTRGSGSTTLENAEQQIHDVLKRAKDSSGRNEGCWTGYYGKLLRVIKRAING